MAPPGITTWLPGLRLQVGIVKLRARWTQPSALPGDKRHVVGIAISWNGPSCFSSSPRFLALPWQVLAQEFPGGEESLSNLEEQAVGVIQNTSPLGAQKITEELERMRVVLQKLRLLSAEEQNRLRGVLEAEEAWELRARKLEKELQEFWKILQRLAQQSVPPDVPTTGTAWTEATERGTTQPDNEACTEDELVARWRHYSVRIWSCPITGLCVSPTQQTAGWALTQPWFGLHLLYLRPHCSTLGSSLV